jgi:hypothetical protein
LFPSSHRVHKGSSMNLYKPIFVNSMALWEI